MKPQPIKGLQSKTQARTVLGRGTYFVTTPCKPVKKTSTVLKTFNPRSERLKHYFSDVHDLRFPRAAQRAREQIRDHDQRSRRVPATKRFSTHVNLKGEPVHRMERLKPIKGAKKDVIAAIPKLVDFLIKAERSGAYVDAKFENFGFNSRKELKLLDTLDVEGSNPLLVTANDFITDLILRTEERFSLKEVDEVENRLRDELTRRVGKEEAERIIPLNGEKNNPRHFI